MPAVATRNAVARAIQLRAATANDERRTIEATISTDGKVAVNSREHRGMIDEILLSSGATFLGQVPLLNQHDRSLDSIIGSARNIGTFLDDYMAKRSDVRRPKRCRIRCSWYRIRCGSPPQGPATTRKRTTQVLVAARLCEKMRGAAIPCEPPIWAYEDSNLGPHPYQGCALNRLSYTPDHLDLVAKR